MRIRILLGLILVLFATAAMADVVTNGGFETGTKINTYFYNAPTWVITDPSNQLGSGVCSTTTCGPPFTPYAGTRAFWGGGYDGMVGLATQSLTTVAGQQYLLEFDLANTTTGTNSWYVQFNGVNLDSGTNLSAFGYTKKWYYVTATGSDVINFGFNNQGTSPTQAAAFMLDNVSMTETPEPASMLLLATGLLGLGGKFRRRK